MTRLTVARTALRLGLALSTAILSTSAIAADRYFCTGDLATGFKLEVPGGWTTTKFHTRDDKFVVEREQGQLWKVTRVGNAFSSHRCEELSETRIICGGLLMGFFFNPKTLRYHELFAHGYVDGDDPANTPALTIGKCVALQ